MARGESWVLNRMATAIHRYPRYEEPLRVVTWSSGVRTFKGYRDFRVFCGDELVAAASSLWLYVNLKTKSLVRVPEAVVRHFPSHPGEVFMDGLDKLHLLPPGAGVPPTCRASVRYSDVDGNGHVNNTTYVDILQTALARAGHSPRPGAIQIQFLKEIPADAENVDVRLEARDRAVAFSLAGPDALFAQGLVVS